MHAIDTGCAVIGLHPFPAFQFSLRESLQQRSFGSNGPRRAMCILRTDSSCHGTIEVLPSLCLAFGGISLSGFSLGLFLAPTMASADSVRSRHVAMTAPLRRRSDRADLPDIDVNCDYATAAFTYLPIQGFVCCADLPETQPCMLFLFLGSVGTGLVIVLPVRPEVIIDNIPLRCTDECTYWRCVNESVAFTDFRKKASDLITEVEHGETLVLSARKTVAEVIPFSDKHKEPRRGSDQASVCDSGKRFVFAILEERDMDS